MRTAFFRFIRASQNWHRLGWLFWLCLLLGFVLAIVFTDFPWNERIPVFLFPAGLAVLFFVLMALTSKRFKYIWFNLGSVLCILSLFELGAFLWEQHGTSLPGSIRVEGVYDCIRDNDLGGRMEPNTTRRARKFVGDEKIYDVQISIDNKGLRLTPPCREDSRHAVLFFGDSFTFGEGVNDVETLPYLLGQALPDTYCVYNFAMFGWGPQQMLSLVENGMVADKVDQRIDKVIYQVLYPDHVFRLAGYFDWDLHGPRYVLDDNKRPVRDGNFDDVAPSNPLEVMLHRASLGKRIFEYFRNARRIDRDRFVSVVLRTQTLLKERTPDLAFHLIIWDWTEGKDAFYFHQLEDAGVILHDVKDILPDGDKTNLLYRISPMDKHPNPYCHRLFADYIIKKIFLLDTSAPESIATPWESFP